MVCTCGAEKAQQEFHTELWELLDKWNDREDLDVHGLLYTLMEAVKINACANFDEYFWMNGVLTNLLQDDLNKMFGDFYEDDKEGGKDATSIV